MLYITFGSDIVSVGYGYRVQDTLQLYSLAFDEQWCKYSPGRIAVVRGIESAIAEGCRQFDFLEGDEEYKLHWATGTRENICVRVYAPNIRGNVLASFHQVQSKLRALSLRYIPQGIRHPLWLLVLRWNKAWMRKTYKVSHINKCNEVGNERIN